MARKITLDNCQSLAESKGGKCLSVEYKDAHKKLEWECKNKHRWSADYTQVFAKIDEFLGVANGSVD